MPSRTESPTRPEPRPVFVLTVEAGPGVAPIRALRWLLKNLARSHGFKCLDAREARR